MLFSTSFYEVFIAILLHATLCSAEVTSDATVNTDYVSRHIGADSARQSEADESQWSIEWHTHSESQYLGDAAATVVMMTKNNEKYDCAITPAIDKFNSEQALLDVTPYSLLRPLFNDKTMCSYRLESFWTYELCHGQHVRQLHDARLVGGGGAQMQYFLGKYSPLHLASDEKAYENMMKTTPNFRPETMMIEDVSHPYFEMVYDGGTVCDLTGAPRLTRVRYVCHERGRHQIVHLQETASCEYLTVILTPLLCKHRLFRLATITPRQIHCVARADSPPIPAAFAAQSAGSVAAVSRASVRPPAGSRLSDTVRQMLRARHARGDTGDKSGAVQHAATTQPPIAAGVAPAEDALVQQILAGQHCLYGGTGWWRYELCYGRRVSQFHVAPDGSRSVIHLGHFSRRRHMAWLHQQPAHKRPPTAGRVDHVWQLYDDGAFCELSGRRRSVEVKIKCRRNESGGGGGGEGSPTAVSMYLLEPRACRYVLAVEAAFLCPLLQQVDRHTGLLPAQLTAADADAADSDDDERARAASTSTQSPAKLSGADDIAANAIEGH